MICIEKNIIVFFRYNMKDRNGQVIESNMDGLPKSYLHGSASVQPALQLQFEGLQTGEAKTILLPNEHDNSNTAFTFDVVIDELRPALDEEIILGYPVLIPKSICKEDCICYATEPNINSDGYP